jgi:RimJ/RimL family protein N-acetyltransferase
VCAASGQMHSDVGDGVTKLMGDAATERLLLERWAPEHAPGLAEINARPEVMRFLNGGLPLSRAESDAVSERVAEHWADHGFGLWAMLVRTTGRMVGFVGICHPLWLPERAHQVEVGWRLHPDVWGRGYATEAGREAIRVAFDDRRMDELIALVHPGNQRSAAVAMRLGMTREERVTHPQRNHEMDVYVARAAG